MFSELEERIILLVSKNTLTILACIILSSLFFCTYASPVSNAEESEYISLSPDFSYKIPVSVAVLPFSNDTGDESLDWLSNGIPESSISKFTASKCIRLIDRGLIDQILDELGLSTSDLTDPAEALKVGRLVAAEIIVRGSYQKRSDDILKIMWRFTDVQTGTIVKADDEIGSQKDMEALLDQSCFKLVQGIDPSVHFQVRPVLKPKSRGGAALKSIVWPGWGDLPERKVSGILMGILQIGALAVSAVSQFDYMAKLDEYNDARDNYGKIESFSTYSEYKEHRELMMSKYEKAEDSRKLRNAIFLSAVIGMRALGALESAIFIPRANGEKHSVTSIKPNGTVMLSWKHEF